MATLYHGRVNESSVTPKFLSRQEAAGRLKVDVAVVDRLIETGVLARYRIRGRWVRVLGREVEELAHFPAEWLRRC